jgi:hypothetical protein
LLRCVRDVVADAELHPANQEAFIVAACHSPPSIGGHRVNEKREGDGSFGNVLIAFAGPDSGCEVAPGGAAVDSA